MYHANSKVSDKLDFRTKEVLPETKKDTCDNESSAERHNSKCLCTK